MANSKIVYYGETLIDLTADTVSADKLSKGITAHDKSGEIITGTNTYDVDYTDGTVTSAEMHKGATAYARGIKITGTMPNIGAVSDATIGSKNGSYTIPQGYHDGSGVVTLTNVSSLVAENIREGVSVLGITGTMSGSEGETPQDSKTVTPSKTVQEVEPDDGYTCLRKVVVNAIPYTSSLNSAGGYTITIG